MKCLLCHVDELSYEDGVRSNRPAELAASTEPPAAETFRDSLAVFATIESGDDAAMVRDMAAEVERQLSMLGNRDVVIVPFGHLSSDLAPKDQATQLLGGLRMALAGPRAVTLTTFGFQKRLRIELKPHRGAVAFRDTGYQHGP